MTRRAPFLVWAAALATCVATTALAPLSAVAGTHSSKSDRATLTVTFDGFRSDAGQALVAMFRSPEGFPDEVDHASFRHAYPIQDRKLEVTIRDVPPGTMALVILHDEDEDFEMDTRIFGIPTEGFGTSRNPHVRFGPPHFDDASFRLKPAEHRHLTVHVRYF